METVVSGNNNLFSAKKNSESLLNINGIVDTSSVMANRDGNLLERTEYILDTIENIRPLTVLKTDIIPIEQNTYTTFALTLLDINGEPLLASAINITGLSATLEKSTDGVNFSVSGITQPIFVKALGRVYVTYQFLTAQWDIGNVYKLTLTGIKATPETTELDVQTVIWSNVITQPTDIDDEVDSILVSVTNIETTDLPAVKSDTGTILVDTNELQTDWTNGGRLDLLLDAVKAKTDNLPSDPADASDISTAFGVTDGKIDAVKSETALIKTETDKIPTTITKIDAIKTKTDLIGALTDDEVIDSVLGRLYITDKHSHAPQKVYPTLANGISITAGATVWTLSTNFVVVVPTNTITNNFDIHFVHIGTFSASDTFELVLYSGADGAETECGRVRFTRNSNTNSGAYLPFQTVIIPANTQIKCKLASQTGGGTVVFSIAYHTY